MASRTDLHKEFCEILNTTNAYFQPPASIKMKYPGIRYSLGGLYTIKAGDGLYRKMNRYEVTLIDTNPESVYFDAIISRFQYCSFDRAYIADGLNHFVFTIYY